MQHRSHTPFVQALSGEHFYIRLIAAAGDLARATCRYADTPHQGPDLSVALQKEASDGIRDWWSALVHMPSRRLRYEFELEFADGTRSPFSERGFTKAAEKHHAGYFHYPYNQPVDRFTLPPWLPGTTFYEIFPERFHNGDRANDPPGTLAWGEKPTGRAFFGGDIAGIRQKLGHLTGLGVGGLWLTPVFTAPTNHKYDPADYHAVDPAFGTTEDLRKLVAECHAGGIRVLLDGVFNHSGSEWFAFRDVREKGEASPYKTWFFKLEGFPVDVRKVNYETFANRLPNHPKLNTTDPGLMEYFLGVGEHWIREAKIDGWRLDVANEVDHRFWRAFRERVKAADPNAFIVGEVWHDASQWLDGDEFDSVQHYPWRDAALRYLRGDLAPSEFASAAVRLRHAYQLAANPGLLHLVGSHDVARVRTELGGSSAKAAQAATLLLTAGGVPLVYYGDEIGMEGGDDPDARRCMEWDETKWDRKIFNTHRTLVRARRERPWLAWGSFEDVVVDDDRGLYAYRRAETGPLGVLYGGGPGQLWVALNTGDSRAEVSIPLGDHAPRRVVDLLSGEGVNVERGEAHLTLSPGDAVVLS